MAAEIQQGSVVTPLDIATGAVPLEPHQDIPGMAELLAASMGLIPTQESPVPSAPGENTTRRRAGKVSPQEQQGNLVEEPPTLVSNTAA